MNLEERRAYWLKEWNRLRKEKKDTFEANRQIQLIHLDQHLELPYHVLVQIISANDCCEECKLWNNKLITVEEAYRIMPIPNKNCKDKRGCRCRYILIAQRKPDGSLKLK
jgi:hypothetical protein